MSKRVHVVLTDGHEGYECRTVTTEELEALNASAREETDGTFYWAEVDLNRLLSVEAEAPASCQHDFWPVFVGGSFMGQQCRHCGAYPD